MKRPTAVQEETVATDNTLDVRRVNAFFDTEGAAQQAVDDLVVAGIPRQNITLVVGQGEQTVPESRKPSDQKGLWASLKDLLLPDEDQHGYHEGLRRGGLLLTVATDEANYHRVLDFLDRDGAVNMDEREAGWRQQGWSGGPTGPNHTPQVAAEARPELSTLSHSTVSGLVSEPAPEPRRAVRDQNVGRSRVRGYQMDQRRRTWDAGEMAGPDDLETGPVGPATR